MKKIICDCCKKMTTEDENQDIQLIVKGRKIVEYSDCCDRCKIYLIAALCKEGRRLAKEFENVGN